MPEIVGSIYALRDALDTGRVSITAVMEACLARSNSNDSKNTYIWQDASWTLAEAARIEAIPEDKRGQLWGVPVSVKDCFDLAGSPTSCGTAFYRELHGALTEDSWLVKRLRDAGAVITGKTHLHPLAYGITGENSEFGDCLQPGNAGALTGGSSSGGAASVLEGSAIAAIGTDTGGSIRVPAALCGLAGYRATIGRGDWQGGAHLAQSFDTMGWLFRDLRDAPVLGSLFMDMKVGEPRRYVRFAVVGDEFLTDCKSAVRTALGACCVELERMGLKGATIDVSWWADAMSIFAPIQAWEAARIHNGHYARFEPAIQQRLEWGAGITDTEITELRERHAEFRARMDALTDEHELLLLPASPVTRLAAGANHSETRAQLLRYTTPVSLAGMPVITAPFTDAGGVQVVAARENDDALLAFAKKMGEARAK